jgi:hypothetical protein
MDVLYHNVVREFQIHRREIPQSAYTQPCNSLGYFAGRFIRYRQHRYIYMVAAYEILKVLHVHDFDAVHFLPD